MVSFGQLWEAMENPPDSPLMDSGEDSEILSVVRAGKDLRQEEESPFWDDFMTLCSNSRGMAALLGVSHEKVINWPGRIREHLEKLETHDAEDPSTKDDVEMVPTGDNGAIVTTNMDPNLGAIQ
jgi:hypothetical protein